MPGYSARKKRPASRWGRMTCALTLSWAASVQGQTAVDGTGRTVSISGLTELLVVSMQQPTAGLGFIDYLGPVDGQTGSQRRLQAIIECVWVTPDGRSALVADR